MEIVVLTIAAIAIVMLIMAVGVILKRPCLRGSCGGPGLFDTDGDAITCAACPNRRSSQQTEQGDSDRAATPARSAG